MKRILLVLITTTFVIFESCNNASTDSKEKADSINDTHAVAADTSQSIPAAISVSENDARFAVDAANGGMAEVELGKLAQSSGSSEEVKAFGQMMITDHSRANEELKAIAQSKNIALPDSVGGDERKMINNLSKKSGKDFDKSYIKAMTEDHKKDIKLFEDAEKSLKDSTLKQFASDKLPTLRKHLSHVEGIKQK
jgi:putative membrane protein